jgi:hypothetical protein
VITPGALARVAPGTFCARAQSFLNVCARFMRVELQATDAINRAIFWLSCSVARAYVILSH